MSKEADDKGEGVNLTDNHESVANDTPTTSSGLDGEERSPNNDISAPLRENDYRMGSEDANESSDVEILATVDHVGDELEEPLNLTMPAANSNSKDSNAQEISNAKEYNIVENSPAACRAGLPWLSISMVQRQNAEEGACNGSPEQTQELSSPTSGAQASINPSQINFEQNLLYLNARSVRSNYGSYR